MLGSSGVGDDVRGHAGIAERGGRGGGPIAGVLNGGVERRHQRVRVRDARQIHGNLYLVGIREPRAFEVEIRIAGGRLRTLLVTSLTRFCTLVGWLALRSTQLFPSACTPLSPKLLVSTVEVLKSRAIEPLDKASAAVLPLPPPMNTDSDLAKVPPWFKPMAWACRSISPNTF